MPSPLDDQDQLTAGAKRRYPTQIQVPGLEPGSDEFYQAVILDSLA